MKSTHLNQAARSSCASMRPLHSGVLPSSSSCASMRPLHSGVLPSSSGGFTLIEIMVVVVILGILAAIVAPNVMRRIDDAQLTKVSSDIRTIETALNLYRMDNFRYPTTEQGIKALYEKPNDSSVRNWKEGGYLDSSARKDPWGNDYRYVYPGTHGKEFDLFTYGADNQEGGEGLDADIGNWTAAEKQ